MVWFRVDDGFADHPKVVRLLDHSPRWPRALALWLLAGTWCAKQLTDGAVPTGLVTRLGFTKADAQALVDAQLWRIDGSGYQFHDWEARNPTRKHIEKRREKTRNKVSNWRGNQVTKTTIDGAAQNRHTNLSTSAQNRHTSLVSSGGDDSVEISRSYGLRNPVTGVVLTGSPGPARPDHACKHALALTTADAAREWHLAMQKAGHASLHAETSWQEEYTTVVSALGVVPEEGRRTGLRAVCEWFWLAPDGPVRARRGNPDYFNPGHLAKRISSDLKAASAWYASLQGAAAEAAT